MPDRADNRARRWRSNWGLILAALAALAIIGAGIAYEYTGDFSGLMTFGTSGRQQPK